MIDIYSSLYTGVALRSIERDQNLAGRIDVSKYKTFLGDERVLFESISEFFNIYYLIACSLKEDDRLAVENQTVSEIK